MVLPLLILHLLGFVFLSGTALRVQGIARSQPGACSELDTDGLQLRADLVDAAYLYEHDSDSAQRYHVPWNPELLLANGSLRSGLRLLPHPLHQVAPIRRVVPGVSHAPILIQGDQDFVSQGWMGSGTALDPYRIENLDINHTGPMVHGIAIHNTRAHFVIRNCLILGVSSHLGDGIRLQNVTEAWLDNNTCLDIDPDPLTTSGYAAVYLRDSARITVTRNTLVSYSYAIYNWGSNATTVANNTCSYGTTGIDMHSGCTSNRIVNNTLTHYTAGILLSSCGENNSIENNLLTANYEVGIAVTLGASLRANRLEGSGFYFSPDALKSYQVEVVNNSVNGKPLVFWCNRVGGGVPEGAGQVVLANCSDVTVSSQTLNNCTVGVLVLRSTRITLVNNTCNFNPYSGIRLSQVNSSHISDNTCQYNGLQPGIALWGSHENTIANNHCVNGTAGISLYFSNSNAVIDNTCSESRSGSCGSGGYGIYVQYGNASTVVNNTCDGAYFSDSHSNRILGNTLTQSRRASICLERSANNTLLSNRLVNSGLFLEGWPLSECRQFLVDNNTVNGSPLIFWQDRRDETVPALAGQVVLIGCSNVTVANQVLSQCGWGILLNWCNQSCLSYNTCTDSIAGIYLLHTNSTQITHNLCTRNGYGIHGDDTIGWNNTISRNTCTFNRYGGIRLQYSFYYAAVTQNICSHNRGSGLLVWGSNNVLEDNVCVNNSGDGICIDGRGTVRYNTCQENSGNGIDLLCSQATVAFNTCTRNGLDGIHVGHWNHNATITNNVCTDNGNSGICLIEAYNCTITYNLSCGNALAGISIGLLVEGYESSDNQVLYNVFAFNGQWNGFDNGTSNRFDHNFWHDYYGTDLDADGIGDTPYFIPGTAGSLDPHPLLQWPGAPSASPLLRLALVGGTVALGTVALVAAILWQRIRHPHRKKRAA